MYYCANAITRFRATATDGELGKIMGFAFDERTFRVRYLLVRVGWLPRRVVRVEPKSVTMVDGAKRRVHLDLTKDELRRQPDIDSDPPVHRLEEAAQGERYLGESPSRDQRRRVASTHLRNTAEVVGYTVATSDGLAGKVSDVVLDTRTWNVCELVARKGWLLRSYRTISPEWVDTIDWATGEVRLGVDLATVRTSRAFDPRAPVNTTRETRVVDYRGNTHLQRRDEVTV